MLGVCKEFAKLGNIIKDWISGRRPAAAYIAALKAADRCDLAQLLALAASQPEEAQ